MAPGEGLPLALAVAVRAGFCAYLFTGRCTQYLVLAMALTQPARAWRVKRDAPLTDLVPSAGGRPV